MQDINHKEILAGGMAKILENAQVPYKVLVGVIKQFNTAIKTHNEEIKKHQKELDAQEGNRKDHEKQISIHNRQIAQYEAELARWKTIAKGEKGDPGRTPVKGVDYFDGTPGVDGHTPTIEELEAIILPLMPDAPEVKTDEIIKAVVELITKKQMLGVDNIKGLREFVTSSKGKARSADGFNFNGTFYQFSELFHGAGTGSASGSITYSYDLSSQCDGVNKTFTVPANTNFVQLSGTDSPIIYKPTTDYTGSGTTTLTLTSAVFAPSAGATLILLYVV